MEPDSGSSGQMFVLLNIKSATSCRTANRVRNPFCPTESPSATLRDDSLLAAGRSIAAAIESGKMEALEMRNELRRLFFWRYLILKLLCVALLSMTSCDVVEFQRKKSQRSDCREVNTILAVYIVASAGMQDPQTEGGKALQGLLLAGGPILIADCDQYTE